MGYYVPDENDPTISRWVNDGQWTYSYDDNGVMTSTPPTGPGTAYNDPGYTNIGNFDGLNYASRFRGADGREYIALEQSDEADGADGRWTETAVKGGGGFTSFVNPSILDRYQDQATGKRYVLIDPAQSQRAFQEFSPDTSAGPFGGVIGGFGNIFSEFKPLTAFATGAVGNYLSGGTGGYTYNAADGWGGEGALTTTVTPVNDGGALTGAGGGMDIGTGFEGLDKFDYEGTYGIKDPSIQNYLNQTYDGAALANPDDDVLNQPAVDQDGNVVNAPTGTFGGNVYGSPVSIIKSVLQGALPLSALAGATLSGGNALSALRTGGGTLGGLGTLGRLETLGRLGTLGGLGLSGGSNSLLFPLLGGLLGALGGSQKPSGTTTTVQDVPEWQKPYITNAFNYAGNAMNDAQDAYAATKPLNMAASNQLQSTINGDFLNNNPYLDATYNRAANNVANRVNSQFSAAGRYGSGAHTGQLTEGLGNLATDIYGGNYQQERQRQFAGSMAAPSFAANSAQAAYTPAQGYANIVGQRFGQQQTQPYYTNPYGGALSGLLGGAALSRL